MCSMERVRNCNLIDIVLCRTLPHFYRCEYDGQPLLHWAVINILGSDITNGREVSVSIIVICRVYLYSHNY